MVSAFEGRPIKSTIKEYERVESMCSDETDKQDLMRQLDGRIYD